MVVVDLIFDATGAKNKRSSVQLTSWAVEEEVRKCEKGRGGNTSLWIWTVKRGGGNPQICNSLFAEHFVLTRYRLICELFGDFVFYGSCYYRGKIPVVVISVHPIK